MILRKKRQDPSTPQIKDNKKQREYQSPIAIAGQHSHTPLRNVIARHSNVPSPLNPSFKNSLNQTNNSNNSSIENDDIDIGIEPETNNRGIILRKKREQKKPSILSPAIGNSPKAALPKKLMINNATNMTIDKMSSPRTNLRHLNTSEAPKLTIEQMSETFERWMRIAINQKIDPKDTWNLALIDYFSELTFLKEGNSINFQKASCTLDGCVKIYSLRVDSIADETGKLLNGFTNGIEENDGNTKKSKKYNNQKDDNENDSDDNMEEEMGSKKSSRKKNFSHVSGGGSTLEKSFDAITIKSLVENILLVDPLFKKISSDFDESSVHGALLSSLPITSKGRILLDSSATTSILEDEENDNNNDNDGKSQKTDNQIDIRRLKSKFEESLKGIKSKTICPTLDKLNLKEPCSNMSSIVKDALSKLDKLNLNSHGTLTAMNGLNYNADAEGDEESNSSDNDDNNLNLNNFHDDGLMDLNDDADMENYPSNMTHDRNYNYNYNYNDNDMQIEGEMGEEEYTTFLSSKNKNGANAISHKWDMLDTLMQKNWAGPDHWKIKRLKSHGHGNNDSDYKKSTKKEFFLDFFTTEVDFDGIYTRNNPSLLVLSKQALEERHFNNNLLPKDLQFTSKRFLNLFIKSNWIIGSKINTIRRLKNNSNNDDQLIDVPKDYWNETNINATHTIADDNDNDNDANSIFPSIDHYDDSDSDLEESNAIDRIRLDSMKIKDKEGINENLIGNNNNMTGIMMPSSINNETAIINGNNLIQPLKSTSEMIVPLSYARRTKHVNVQKLKDTIWSEMTLSLEKKNSSNTGNKKKESITINTFGKIIDNIGSNKDYPSEEIKDVSTSFCFICLLHLANEHGLHLENTANGDIKIQS